MKLTQKFWVLCLVAVCAVVSIHRVGWDTLAVLANRDALIQFFSEADGSPIRGIGLFLLAHIVANAVGVPGTLLVVVGGAVYGLWWGTLWSVIGATLGAIAAFWLARHLFYDWFKQRFSQRPFFQKINQTICKSGLACVLIIRFSPISPFNAVNFALGLTPVSLRYYAAGTLIGIIPGTLAYTWLGVTGAEALSGGSLTPLILCLIGLMALSALPLIIQNRSLLR